MSAAAALKWDEFESGYFHRTYCVGPRTLWNREVGTAVPFLDKPLKFRVLCAQHGTAVLKA